MTPTLVTSANWTGQTQERVFYNNNSRNVDVTFHWRRDSSWGPFTACLTLGTGGETHGGSGS